MNENLDPVAVPPEAAPSEATTSVAEQAARVTPGNKKIAGLWAGALAAVLLAGGAGYAVGNHGGGDRIDRVSFNGPMMGGGDDRLGGNGQLGTGNGQMGKGQMGNGQGMQPGQGMGPHCENTAGDHTAVNSDGTCPSGYTLDDRGGRGFNQPQPNPSASSTL